MDQDSKFPNFGSGNVRVRGMNLASPSRTFTIPKYLHKAVMEGVSVTVTVRQTHSMTHSMSHSHGKRGTWLVLTPTRSLKLWLGSSTTISTLNRRSFYLPERASSRPWRLGGLSPSAEIGLERHLVQAECGDDPLQKSSTGTTNLQSNLLISLLTNQNGDSR